MTAPLLTERTVEHLDFAPACCATRTDDPETKCPETAVAYIELHRLGGCKDRSCCNASGNMTGLICQKHADLFMARARSIVDAPTPICCGSCLKPLCAVSDIIVRLEML